MVAILAKIVRAEESGSKKCEELDAGKRSLCYS